jgi:hypothetical protein
MARNERFDCTWTGETGQDWEKRDITDIGNSDWEKRDITDIGNSGELSGCRGVTCYYLQVTHGSTDASDNQVTRPVVGDGPRQQIRR